VSLTCSSASWEAQRTLDTSIKWKPPSENSIDFKLVLRFPPSRSQTSVPDYQAKPFFALHVYCGEERGVPKYEPYDEMYVKDEEWEQCVAFPPLRPKCI
jgi:mRNA guanylyltransferase